MVIGGDMCARVFLAVLNNIVETRGCGYDGIRTSFGIEANVTCVLSWCTAGDADDAGDTADVRFAIRAYHC